MAASLGYFRVYIVVFGLPFLPGYNLWSADLHGQSGVFLALFATALGVVPEQVLRGQRVLVLTLFLQVN